jgi:hypothetical protein
MVKIKLRQKLDGQNGRFPFLYVMMQIHVLSIYPGNGGNGQQFT